MNYDLKDKKDITPVVSKIAKDKPHYRKIFRHAEYESARRDLNFLWEKSLSY